VVPPVGIALFVIFVFHVPVGWGIAIGVAAYFVECAVWPNRKCRRCDGGKRPSPLGTEGFRKCPTCGGTGRRRRWGQLPDSTRRRLVTPGCLTSYSMSSSLTSTTTTTTGR